MRIDDRKVNGCIKLQREDMIETWSIVVGPMGCVWAAGFNESNIIEIPNSVAGAAILAKMETFDTVLITVISISDDIKMLPFPPCAFNKAADILSIDIGEIMPGNTLEIALPSGAITMKENQ